MKLTKTAETPTSITLSWEQVPGAVGYRFIVDGKSSHTWDPTRTSVKVSKGAERTTVEALGALDSGVWPDTAPPDPTFKTSVSEGMTMNLPYTWTFTPGDVAAKGQFWANGRTLHEATGPGPYTYVVPKDELANGANEVGHSWDTTAGQHVAAAPTYHVTVAGSSVTVPPVEPPPVTGGTLIWKVDYKDGTDNEWFAAKWGGGGGHSSGQHNTVVNRNGAYAAQLTIPAGQRRSEYGVYLPDTVQDVDRFFGTEIELPTNLDWTKLGPNGINITQHDQSNGQASAPFHFQLGSPSRQPRGISLLMMTGTWQALPVFGTGLEYVTGDTSWAGHVLPAIVVIPNDQVPLGVRIQLIMRSFRTGKNTGQVQTWWRKRGEATWKQGTPQTLSKTNAGQGFPTLQHYPGQPYGGHEVYPDTLVSKWGAYAGADLTAQFQMWHYRAAVGTTFDVVAAHLSS